LAVATKAPPIAIALGPTPIFRNGAAVEPTLVWANIVPAIIINIVNVLFKFSPMARYL
jgi:hypothetical protein